MRISDALETLKTELALGKTPKGRILTDFAKENLKAAIGDIKNHQTEATRCKNCGLVQSELLIADGCPNCGGLDFDANVG